MVADEPTGARDHTRFILNLPHDFSFRIWPLGKRFKGAAVAHSPMGYYLSLVVRRARIPWRQQTCTVSNSSPGRRRPVVVVRIGVSGIDPV